MVPNPNNGTHAGQRLLCGGPALGDPHRLRPVSTVVKAEAFIDTLGYDRQRDISMEAADGAFSTPTENVYLDIPLATVGR